MDNFAAYMIMILSPFFWLVSKLSIHYTILYDYVRKNHSKSYIKKNRRNLVDGYFMWDYKNEISSMLYYTNMALGVMVIIGFAGSIVYLSLATVGYRIKLIVIPTIVCYFDIFLGVARIVRLIFDKKAKK